MNQAIQILKVTSPDRPSGPPTAQEVSAKFREAFALLDAYFTVDPEQFFRFTRAVGGQLQLVALVPGNAAANLATVQYPGDPL